MAGVGLLLALLCTPSHSEEKWYALEFVIFARSAPDLADEYWPAYRAAAVSPQPPAAGESNSAAASPWPGLKERRLTAIADRLDRSPAYRVLLHGGWRQTLTTRLRTRPVPVTAQPDARLAEASTPAEWAPSSARPSSTAPLGAPPRLTGTLRLFTTQHLRIEADLRYAARVPIAQLWDAPTRQARSTQPAGQLQWQPDPLTTQDWAALPLQETRGVLLADLHYFDHPAFGMIAQVRRSTPPNDTPKNSLSVDSAEQLAQ